MKAWSVWLAGAGVVIACFAAARVLDSGSTVPNPVALTPEQIDAIERTRSDHPANQPFPGPEPSLSVDQRKAVAAAAPLAWAGAQTSVISVERVPYGVAMCGLANYALPDVDVWMVWLKGPFRAIVPSGNAARQKMPWDFESAMFLIDAESFTSLQSFHPWPLERSPVGNCHAP